MKNIEAEVRSFLSKEEYEKLLDFFKENAEFQKEDFQETVYFDSKKDLRIQKSDHFSKIWLKEGRMHDDCREELEIGIKKDDFWKVEKLFLSLGYKARIRWKRKRVQFKWRDINVCLDFTKGFGYLIELEKMVSENEKEGEHKRLQKTLSELGIKATSKEELERRFNYYKENWEKLIK